MGVSFLQGMSAEFWTGENIARKCAPRKREREKRVPGDRSPGRGRFLPYETCIMKTFAMGGNRSTNKISE